MYSVIKYQDLEFNSEPLFQPIAAYKGSKNGGDDRNRTCDPLNANQVLSQLSYIPVCQRNLVAGTGFEPATFGLWAQRATGLLHPASKSIRWWAWVDSNYRPHAYQACALTNWATGPQVVSQSQRIKAKHQLHSSNQSVKRSITVDYLKTRYVSLRFWPC